MAFSLTLQAPLLRELSLTHKTAYLEVGRFSLFMTLWDKPLLRKAWLGIARHQAGRGVEAWLGPLVLSVGI